MTITPQPDALVRDIVVTYNDPRIPANGRDAYRGTLVMYVGSGGYAVLLSKQGDGPTEWEPVTPPPTGNVNQYLRGDHKWEVPPASGLLVGGLLPASALAPIVGPALLGNASSGSGSVAALSRTQSRSVIGMQVISKSADTPFATNTFTDVPLGASGTPTFGWSLLANKRYCFRFTVLVRSSQSTVGPGLTLTMPTYTEFGAAAMLVGQVVTGPSVVFAAPITVSQGPAIAASVDTADTDYVFTVEGVIVPNASGALTLQARRETGTATITVRRGSFGVLFEE